MQTEFKLYFIDLSIWFPPDFLAFPIRSTSYGEHHLIVFSSGWHHAHSRSRLQTNITTELHYLSCTNCTNTTWFIHSVHLPSRPLCLTSGVVYCFVCVLVLKTLQFLVCVAKQTDQKQASRFSNVRTNAGFWLAGLDRWRWSHWSAWGHGVHVAKRWRTASTRGNSGRVFLKETARELRIKSKHWTVKF